MEDFMAFMETYSLSTEASMEAVAASVETSSFHRRGNVHGCLQWKLP